ncbi:hypothetical protein CBI38_24650 [Rhodococcus oxybenzonivorans]|uniref:DNA primase/polymerase bifunctional N-terminal domain-containing protein n=1 Tax=Rhodococcus oxybenzonivorans TaxID=1990687 RepID=A0A2S2C0J9_9NOCA|nr:bifunctional DNA primase/polymerase [Rhodococcus oxybenzonivorans]AWK74268.1 hypothetical protein CBI38_24650 [Rhodococcus oxybenzonivorans]
MTTLAEPMVAHALSYARSGIPVFPGEDKTPLTPNGFKAATTDADMVRDYWGRFPDANVLGCPPVGTVLVDLDRARAKPGEVLTDEMKKDRSGLIRMVNLQNQYGRLPATRCARTGGNGLHIWFGCEGPFVAKPFPGIDIKVGATGYVVLPPSLHASGRRYEWLSTAPIARCPRWLRDLIVKKPHVPRPVPERKQVGGSGEGLVNTVLSAQEGGRNSALHWAACRAHENGILDDIEQDLVGAGLSIGLDVREIDSTIRSARGGA